MRSIFLYFFIAITTIQLNAQAAYWQQEVSYNMQIDMNVESNQFKGIQKLVYKNNSPDTLNKVFYHLYYNAFQPGSMMDVRSRTISDPDSRVGARIAALKDDEIGYQKINKLSQDGKKLTYKVVGTILEVELAKPILPGASTSFTMDFEAQVPLQVRRTGRDNKEGIRYSMTQWYPKMVEYDKQGWHANPYIGREFHGVWGNFDVAITIDSKYILGATGYLENANEIGYGYADENIEIEHGEKLTWKFTAPMVHDFAWVADPDFTHKTTVLDNGTTLHFLYQADSNTTNWDSLPHFAVKIFEEMNQTFGEYPYKQYTVAQGGDGGMEYPMLTLITGHRSKGSLVGVTAHEAIHSWYQLLLATNESLYPWMDEGFTSYAEDVILPSILPKYKPFSGSYRSYFNLVESGKQEVLTTHADHYKTNRAYGVASYSMGLIFCHQLSYIVGYDVFLKGMKRYFNEWKYKHPTPNDFIRIIEKESGLELDWYLNQWIASTNTIDYGIKWMKEKDGLTTLTLEKIGELPMPLDIYVKYKNGKEEWINIPLRIMSGNKLKESNMGEYRVSEAWPWTYNLYELKLSSKIDNIESIVIDPSERMADINRENNTYPLKNDKIFKTK
ncbi:MAG: M1 family metallopeptidase [Flavobacteriales bacterium]|nr:M1 family metallopeptidase [Flavobacteriales bacterium]